MLYPAPIKKIVLVFHKNRRERLVSALHEAGVIQLKEASSIEGVRRQVSEQLENLVSLLSSLHDMEELLGVYKGKPRPVPELTLESTLKKAEQVVRRIEPKIKKYREALDSLQKESQSVREQISALTPFSALDHPLRHFREGRFLHVVAGLIDEDVFEEFSKAVYAACNEKAVVYAVGKARKLPVVIACKSTEKSKLAPLLYRFGVELVDLPDMRETPSAAIAKLQSRLDSLERKRRIVEQKLRRLGRQYLQDVVCARETLEIQKERLEAAGLFGGSDMLVVLEGWVLARDLKKVERLVKRHTRGRSLMLVTDPSPAEIREVPIQLQNPEMVKDFEFLTRMYGLPRYNEVDPTWLLSLTFPVFFGICLSDAGYGLALAAFMLSGLWFVKSFPPYLRRMMALCGIVTAIVSVFIGGWFGFGGGLWVNPVENPIPLLKLVIFIGMFHLILAFGVAGVLKDLRQKSLVSVFSERLARIFLLLGFFGLSFSVLGVGLHEFGINYTFPRMELFSAFNPFAPASLVTQISRGLFYGGIGLGAVGAMISGRGVRGKLGGVINTVYGITGLIADVTSYTRLLALGIATGVIAFSINFIISIFWGWLVSPYLTASPAILVAILGAVALGFVFVAGHSFNIFISTLGGFIHTMRLHFAEFFGKFYEGGGEPFTPFKAKRRFTILRGGVRIGK